MNIVIIGLGLIGGSLGLALKGFQTRIIGVDANPEHCKQAIELGLVENVMPLEEAIKIADLILLAIPVNYIVILLPEILDKINDNAVVADMGSTKSLICNAVRKHSRRKNFVASHPIAGTENTGPAAAFNTLYDKKITIICEKKLSADFAISMVVKMYQLLNMQILFMEPESHDRHIAYVSHISHISSFMLGLTVLEIEKSEKTIFNMAGSGFASTVRLAKSSPDMWNPIFEQNSKHIVKALDAYIQKLSEFKKHIEDNQWEDLHHMMKTANGIRRILK